MKGKQETLVNIRKPYGTEKTLFKQKTLKSSHR